MSVLNWDMVFRIKDINEKYVTLHETLLDIFNNFISNNLSKVDYKKAVWMNKEITFFLEKNQNFLRNITMLHRS